MKILPGICYEDVGTSIEWHEMMRKENSKFLPTVVLSNEAPREQGSCSAKPSCKSPLVLNLKVCPYHELRQSCILYFHQFCSCNFRDRRLRLSLKMSYSGTKRACDACHRRKVNSSSFFIAMIVNLISLRFVATVLNRVGTVAKLDCTSISDLIYSSVQNSLNLF